MDSPAGRKADVRALFQTWHSPIPEVIEVTPGAEILRNGIVDRLPLANWGRGRVTLLGDAAHPTSPNLGQGACQAIEDAICLAASLAKVHGVEKALRHYEPTAQFSSANPSQVLMTFIFLATEWRHAPLARLTAGH